VSGVGATASKKKRKKAVRSFVVLTLLTFLTHLHVHTNARHRHFYPLLLATIHIALFMVHVTFWDQPSKTALFCATVPQRLSIHNINDGRPTRQSRRRQIETN
jgi:hypothetical protein